MTNQEDDRKLSVPDRYVYVNNVLYEWECRQVYNPNRKDGQELLKKTVDKSIALYDKKL
jgi:hypothetical protein